MASLTDTYRMMNGEEPVNKERITEEDKTKIEMGQRGNGGKAVTQNFIDDMKRIRDGQGLIVENKTTTTSDSIRSAIMDVLSNGETTE
jgi:hypothetical protein